MLRTTLRTKFSIALLAVVIVAMFMLMSARLLSKAALFHYLEREHIATVLVVDGALWRMQASDAGAITKAELLKKLEYARSLAMGVDRELLLIEQWAFRALGFGSVIDLPRKDIDDIDGILGLIAADPADAITPPLQSAIAPGMQALQENSERFGPLVVEAVSFVKMIAFTINILGGALLVFTFVNIRRAVLGPLDGAMRVAERVAAGDLTRTADSRTSRGDEFGALLGQLEQARASLHGLVSGIRAGTESMSTSIHEVAVGAQDLSVRTEKQAAALQQTSATMAEISTTVKECGTRLQQADQLSREARIAARRSEEAVGDVARGMEGIHASSKKIGDITGIIDGIAFQTNILSLNAAVEAARAGEQGRGFAVVAAEVRSLAQRTAAAAKEIQALIRDASAKVIVGVGQAEAAGLALTETMHSVQRVSTLIAEVSSTFGEQETGVVQVEQAIAELDSVTQQNAAMVEQSAATAASVSDQSRSLVESVATFRLGNELLETQATAL